MAYNFLTLVNDINRRLNEVPLTNTNFASATGQYSAIKDAVNSSIRHINHEEFNWPWNHVEQIETLTAGESRYSYPYDTKVLKLDSFRIKRDDTLNVETTKLRSLDYEEYLEKYIDNEYNTSTSIRNLPTHVANTPSQEFVLVPTPDKAYELIYEYYTVGVDLELYSDVPTIPQQYKYVIVDGAMFYAYQFQGDMQAAQIAQNKFQQGIKNMRTLNINRIESLRDTRIHHNDTRGYE